METQKTQIPEMLIETQQLNIMVRTAQIPVMVVKKISFCIPLFPSPLPFLLSLLFLTLLTSAT